MINDLKITKEDLLAIALCLRYTNTLNKDDSKDLSNLKKLIPGSICVLLRQCFGEYNTELIWNYAINSQENVFNSIDELYNYISDPHLNLVNIHFASSLTDLLKLYPQDEMFKTFKQYIKKNNHKIH